MGISVGMYTMSHYTNITDQSNSFVSASKVNNRTAIEQKHSYEFKSFFINDSPTQMTDYQTLMMMMVTTTMIMMMMNNDISFIRCVQILNQISR